MPLIFFRGLFFGAGEKRGLLGTIFERIKETYYKPYQDNDSESMRVLYSLLMETSLCTMIDVVLTKEGTIGTMNIPGTSYFPEKGKCIIGTLLIEVNIDERVVKNVEFIADVNHGFKLRLTNQENE